MLSDKKREVLANLEAFSRSKYQWIDGWARPMDIGARDASHHSGTLRQLALEGLVECKRRHYDKIYTPDELRALSGKFGRGGRGIPKVYRITDAGRQALEE